MITARPQKDLKAARSYFRKHLSRGDYYLENRRINGQWMGKGAERLGLDLAAPVTEKAFVRLCENRHPITGGQLTVRHRRKDRRVFFDFTCSPPKSVSILALTAGDRRIIAAHEEACRVALTEMEKAAAARIRKNGQRRNRTTGEIVAAVFQHEESRALDPLLHSHFVIFNATWDKAEQRWKALETSAMFDHNPLHTEVYRNELAHRLRALGYQLRQSVHGFEIAGVPPEIIERFSKRRRAILEEEARLAAKLGAPLSNNARAAVAHATRQRKRQDLTPDEILAHQRAQLGADELAALHTLVRSGSTSEPNLDPDAVRAAIDYAREHLFERNSAVREMDLLKEALAFARGATTLTALQDELARRTEFIKVGSTLTTKEALRQEQRMVAFVNQGLGGCRPLRAGIVAPPSLTGEQRQAFELILRSPDEVMALRGRAGTGKTRLLREIVSALEARHAVVVLAPMAAAVEVLRQQGFKATATVQRFLADPEFQRSAQGKAILVDEAGFLSVHDLLSLIEVTRAKRCRLILSGDSRQHSGVEAGDALRILEDHSQLRPVELKSIQRQVNLEYRQAIAELAQGSGLKALQRLERLGAVQETKEEHRYLDLASRYADSIRSGKSALIVSPTWREIERVTAEVRSRLKEEKFLSQDETGVMTHHSLKWTRAQRKDLRNYAPGMVLTFHKPTRDFQRGEWAEIRAVLPDRLTVRKTGGQTVVVTRKHAACFDVAEQVRLAVAPGERLLIQGNRKSDKLFNGQIVTVKAVQPDGAIALMDGRNMAADFRAFTYGYCITSHASQGRTVDHVHVAVDSQTLRAAHLKQFYVSTSRAREQVRIYTDDAAFLHRVVTQPGQRLSATELAESARQAARLSPEQKPANRMSP